MSNTDGMVNKVIYSKEVNNEKEKGIGRQRFYSGRLS